VACLVSVGIIGFFLPVTIYLQSVLGYSAIKAGLILAPMSLVGVVLAPIAGKLSDRIGGKYLLMAGLTLFAIGGGWLTVLAEVGTSWPTFIPAVLVLGVGFGGIFAPMATETMRSVPPQLAGAAAGVNNTIRQVGSVVGSAAVGALLQYQLAGSLQDEAVRRSVALPASVRAQFVAGFGSSGAGVDIGRSDQLGPLPSGLPAQVVEQIHQVAAAVFQHGYVRALHPTLALPIGAMLVAAACCLAAQRQPGVPVAVSSGPVSSASAAS